MGNFWQRLASKLRNKEMRILMVGLDAAGKTTTLYKLKLGEVVTTIPTIGFNVETIEYKGVAFTTWDVSGRDGIRPLWRHYYQNTDAVIFVVDSNDRERLPECKDELWRFLREDELKDCVFLILANKQDLPNALSTEEITERMELNAIRDHRWYIQGTCATTGDGLYDSLDWLQSTLTQKEIKKAVVKPVEELVTEKDAPEKPSLTLSSWFSSISKYFVRAQ